MYRSSEYEPNSIILVGIIIIESNELLKLHSFVSTAETTILNYCTLLQLKKLKIRAAQPKRLT